MSMKPWRLPEKEKKLIKSKGKHNKPFDSLDLENFKSAPPITNKTVLNNMVPKRSKKLNNRLCDRTNAFMGCYLAYKVTRILNARPSLKLHEGLSWKSTKLTKCVFFSPAEKETFYK